MTKLIAQFTIAGFLGWVIENALYGPRQSRLFHRLPIMPIYGLGGVLVGAVAPKLTGLPLGARALVYGASLTGLELAACTFDRATGGRSWDYGSSCVDLPHAAAWAGLGLVAERLALAADEARERLSGGGRRYS